MKKIFSTILIAATAFTACEQEMIEQTSGDVPSLEGTDATFIEVRSSRTLSNVIPVTFIEGGANAVEYISAHASKPLAFAEALTVEADETLVEAFAQGQGLEGAVVLPKHFYDFEEGGAFMIEAGEKNSSYKKLHIYAVNAIGNVLPAGTYVLPVKAGSFSRDLKAQTLYYVVRVNERYDAGYGCGLYEGDDLMSVFYLNTDDYDPRLSTEFNCMKNEYGVFGETDYVWFGCLGRILNLRTVMLDYDEVSGRAILNLGNNITHVLTHADTYIEGARIGSRKICLCIEGSGKGLGFCNLSDSQIADLVHQIKTVLDAYGLDGVNLWDRNSGYGKEGMPQVNTTSYPKFIKVLREALGDGRLITVTDHLEPTEYFWDTEATGGIKVGEYIDYAWSGYYQKDCRYYVVDPWHQDASMVASQYPRKPIAGLEPSRYGCVHISWMAGNADMVEKENQTTALWEWRRAGYKQSNIIVYEDLRTNLQDSYESADWNPANALNSFMDDCHDAEFPENNQGVRYMYVPYSYRIDQLPSGASGYGKWKKDW